MRSSKLAVLMTMAVAGLCAKPPKTEDDGGASGGGGGGGGGTGGGAKDKLRLPQLAEDVLVWRREGWLNSSGTGKNHGFRAGKVVGDSGGNQIRANIKATLDHGNDHSGLNVVDYEAIPVFETGTDAERKKRSESFEAWAEFLPEAE